jgi:hypothetical protein
MDFLRRFVTWFFAPLASHLALKRGDSIDFWWTIR